MTWRQQVNEKDVMPAFEHIYQALHHAEEPMYVIVDITAQPHFPMSTTLSGILNGSHIHPNMAGWLVIGRSRLATVIEQCVIYITRRNIAHWFNNADEVVAYLQGFDIAFGKKDHVEIP